MYCPQRIWPVLGLTMAILTPVIEGGTIPSFQGLGDLAGGIFQSFAAGVSADGSVVVGQGNSASGVEAFRCTSGGGLVGLGNLGGVSFFSRASGVSADGSVVVGVSNSGSGFEAYPLDERGRHGRPGLSGGRCLVDYTADRFVRKGGARDLWSRPVGRALQSGQRILATLWF